jgi:hypothetical protein
MAVEPTEHNPTFSTRRNKFGQLSALFADTDASEETSHGEHMILRTLRESIARRHDPLTAHGIGIRVIYGFTDRSRARPLVVSITGDFDRRVNPTLSLSP